MSSYLIVVAHPDDEVLGAGATMYKLAKEGHVVNIAILSKDVTARENRPEIEQLSQNMNASMEILKASNMIESQFPNIAFNTVPHLALVQFIEKCMEQTSADIVITHHPADLNNDHLHTSIACQAAVRLFQRRKDVKPIKELLCMEVPSSTDWSLNPSFQPFCPNTFVEIGKEALEKKLEALSQYVGVMRDYPHPRSVEALKGLAAYRGGQAGVYYAEAFECVFRRNF